MILYSLCQFNELSTQSYSLCEDAPFQSKCFQYPEAWVSYWDTVGIVLLASILAAGLVSYFYAKRK